MADGSALSPLAREDRLESYPLWTSFVVVATGNHYFTDVVLGALTAVVSAVIANRWLAARPIWRFDVLGASVPRQERS